MALNGGLWLAILITLVASTASSVGKALQKEATRNLPRFSLEEKILRQYRLNRTWIAGLVADLAGGIIQIGAFALAPVSVVQPVSGVGLVGLAVYSHFFLKEKLQDWEWVAVGMAGVGTLGLGACSSGSSAGDAAPSPHPARMLAVLLMIGGTVASLTAYRQRRVQRQRRTGSDKAVAALYGLQAGGCFGLSASCCRIGFLMGGRWPFIGLAGSVALSATGFVLQTCGLKEGSTVVVCTCVAVTSMVTGVAVGLLGLGEPLPGSITAALMLIVSWNLILMGVAALSSGPGGMQELLAAALQRVPDHIWKRLPTEVAVKAKSWSATRSSGGALPEVRQQAAGAAGLGDGGGSGNIGSTLLPLPSGVLSPQGSGIPPTHRRPETAQ